MIKLAIDFGSSQTKIYRADSGYGIVLVEPSCVAVRGIERDVVAVGKEAKRLIGKTAEFTEIVFPVYEGEIVDEELAVVLLKRFLEKAGASGNALKRAEVVFALPCGADSKTRSDYRLLCEECGMKKVRFVETPFLAALGAEALLTEADPVLSIDIGAGITNVAVVSLYGVISGMSMNIGGNNIDSNIISRLEEKGLSVGTLTAERIKNEVGSLSPSARGMTVAEGRSTEHMRPATMPVQSTEIADCIRVYIDKIVEYTDFVLKNLPAEVAATIGQNGLYLSGGVAKISYVPEYIAKKLEIRVHTAPEPQYAVVQGGGMIMRDKEALDAIGSE